MGHNFTSAERAIQSPDSRDRNPRLPTDAAREALMLQAAKLFFRLDRSQTEIAADLGLTRWQVSRLLAEARSLGIVRIEIAPRLHRLPDLESRLQAAFGLRDAIVVQSAETEAQAADGVARAAAEYLAALQPKPGLIGVSWGRTMAAVARSLPQGWAPGLHVVQVNGAVSLRLGMPGTHAVAEAIARAAPGPATMLPAPAILGSATSRAVLQQDRVVADVLDLAESAPVLMFSMGAAGPDSVHVASGYLTAAEMQALQDKGAVGDIMGRFIDAEGRIVDAALDDRTLGLGLGSLAGRERRIGVVAGAAKHAVALAALRAHHVNVLIADEATALSALEACDD